VHHRYRNSRELFSRHPQRLGVISISAMVRFGVFYKLVCVGLTTGRGATRPHGYAVGRVCGYADIYLRA